MKKRGKKHNTICFVVHFQKRHLTTDEDQIRYVFENNPLSQNIKSYRNFYYLRTVRKLKLYPLPKWSVKGLNMTRQTKSSQYINYKWNRTNQLQTSAQRQDGGSFISWNWDDKMHNSFLQSCMYTLKTGFYSPKAKFTSSKWNQPINTVQSVMPYIFLNLWCSCVSTLNNKVTVDVPHC